MAYVFDSLMDKFIKDAKKDMAKGKIDPMEFMEAMNKIHKKINEFNGITNEEFWIKVHQL